MSTLESLVLVECTLREVISTRGNIRLAMRDKIRTSKIYGATAVKRVC